MSDDFFQRSPGQRFATPPAQPGTPAVPSAQFGAPVPGPAPDAPAKPPHKVAERYRTRHGWVAAVVLAVVVVVFIGVVVANNRPSGEPGATPSPPPTPTQPRHTPPVGGQGIEFTAASYRATGYWEILNYTWDDQGVTLTCRLTVDSGTLRYSWLALDNTSSDVFVAASSSTLLSGTVSQGQSVSGSVRFNKNRGATEIILADARQSPITALNVEA